MARSERVFDPARWRAAALLGLVTSTFSTLVASLGAGRLGQDPLVDWMVVAAIPLRSGMIDTAPHGPAVAVGILFHQWADVSWALFFFGLLGRWTGRLSPPALLLLAGPWALLTSALEWCVLVPLLPFWQPVFPLEQSYALGLTVHLASSSLYPLFPWLRDRLEGDAGPVPKEVSAGRNSHRLFARIWGGLALAGLAGLAVLYGAAAAGRELPHRGDPAFDRGYIVRMNAHHAQGVVLARLAVAKAEDPGLQVVARLMVASQQAEMQVFARWWASWFGQTGVPPATPQDQTTMPGMIPEADIAHLRAAEGAAFDALFTNLMTRHHEGAIRMADEEMAGGSDLRLRLMASTIRHGQAGEIALMQGASGPVAVRRALANQMAATRSLLDAGRSVSPPERGGMP